MFALSITKTINDMSINFILLNLKKNNNLIALNKSLVLQTSIDYTFFIYKYVKSQFRCITTLDFVINMNVVLTLHYIVAVLFSVFIGMSTEINQKFHSSVEAHMTSGQISAQNTTIGKCICHSCSSDIGYVCFFDVYLYCVSNMKGKIFYPFKWVVS